MFKASRNKADYIFAFGYCKVDPVNFRWIACITPKAYFAAEGCVYDQHLPVDIDGWVDVMEGFYGPEEDEDDPDKLYSQLSAQGLEWSKELTDFLKGGDMEFTTMYWPGMAFVPPAPDPSGNLNPPVVSAHAGVSFRIGNIAVKAPACISGLTKIDTAACKKAIVEMVKANPGLVSKDFYLPTPAEAMQMDLDASKEKNWKRREKGRTCNGVKLLTERSFDCEPFEDQLRAYVRDDGKQIVAIEIEGE